MQMREAGLVPANGVIVVSLDTWQYGRAYSRCVVPPELDPQEVDMRFVAGLDVIIVWEPARTALARHDALIHALLRCRPATLLVCAMGDVVQWLWIKSRRLGIELEQFK